MHVLVKNENLDCLKVLDSLELLILVACLAIPLVYLQAHIKDEDIGRVETLLAKKDLLY